MGKQRLQLSSTTKEGSYHSLFYCSSSGDAVILIFCMNLVYVYVYVYKVPTIPNQQAQRDIRSVTFVKSLCHNIDIWPYVFPAYSWPVASAEC